MMVNKVKKKSNPYMILLIIPFQLIVDILVVIWAFHMEMMRRPGVTGHPTGLMTAAVAVIMIIITVFVVAIALTVMIIKIMNNKN